MGWLLISRVNKFQHHYYLLKISPLPHFIRAKQPTALHADRPFPVPVLPPDPL